MLNHIRNRFWQQFPAILGMVLFAAVISAALCGIERANQEELEDYQQVYAQIPVEVTVTNLTGNRSDYLSIPGWMADLFDMDPMTSYVSDVKIKMRHLINKECSFFNYDLVGITSLELADGLDPYLGGSITFYPGFDESLFAGDELVCLIPDTAEDLVEEDGTVTLAFRCERSDAGAGLSDEEKYQEGQFVFTVAGTYSSSRDTQSLYCSYLALKYVQARMACDREIDSISATLKDNSKLEDFRVYAANWFAEPDVSGAKTPWNFMTYDHYPFALEIDDVALRRVSAILMVSITLNRFAALMVFLLSAGAGFFIGFLIVRNRKQEILLMRTMGRPNRKIYLDFVLEQMPCILAGALLGGSFYGWHPAGRLILFVAVYFVGLSAALIVFLRDNLLAKQKEEG